MKKLLLLLTFLVFSVGFSVQAEELRDPETRELLDFSVEPAAADYPYYYDHYNMDADKHYLHFEDGSVWKACSFRDQDSSVLDSWAAGDEIRLRLRHKRSKERMQSGKFVLKNVTQDSVVYGNFVSGPSEPDTGIYIEAIDERGFFLRLSDDSSWTIPWVYSWTTWNWKPGQQVMVNDADGEGLYTLINCSENGKAACSRTTVWR